MQAIPSRVSDAGPVDQPERPMRWDDHAEVAEDELRDARRLFRDDLALQRKLRLECLDRAQTELDRARALLEGAAVYAFANGPLPQDWEH